MCRSLYQVSACIYDSIIPVALFSCQVYPCSCDGIGCSAQTDTTAGAGVQSAEEPPGGELLYIEICIQSYRYVCVYEVRVLSRKN